MPRPARSARTPKRAKRAKRETRPRGHANKLPDIKPETPITSLDLGMFEGRSASFAIEKVAKVVGFSPTFIRRVVGGKRTLSIQDVLRLLEQDAFAETFVPRSKVIRYLLEIEAVGKPGSIQVNRDGFSLKNECALKFLRALPSESVQCVVTSTPYWGLRIYKDAKQVKWADGADCVYGHEQTPEAFIRHSTELLHEVYRVLKIGGSVWWNVMDSFNTRTQIRGSAVEALRAMQGKEKRGWKDYDCRRYSAGHAYLKDGEQCLIPSRIAERASRLGFYIKSVITWAKPSTLPEPQESRVSRNLEYVLHLTKRRTPIFNKSAYLNLPSSVGGRNNGWETAKLSDVWTLSTSSGRDGHGAQFPVALPARCIALSTAKNDLVLDPFVGAGNSGVAAVALDRKFIGVDISKEYLKTAQRKIMAALTERRAVPLHALADTVEAEVIDDPLSATQE